MTLLILKCIYIGILSGITGQTFSAWLFENKYLPGFVISQSLCFLGLFLCT